MKPCYIVAPITLLIGIPAGVILLLPCCMCWDACEKTKTSMKCLGVSGFSVIPIVIASSIASIVTKNCYPLSANLIPVAGITIAFVIASCEKKDD